MSSPSDNSDPNRRVTLPPIRHFFRDEFMHSPPPPPNELPSTLALAELSSIPSPPLPSGDRERQSYVRPPYPNSRHWARSSSSSTRAQPQSEPWSENLPTYSPSNAFVNPPYSNDPRQASRSRQQLWSSDPNSYQHPVNQPATHLDRRAQQSNRQIPPLPSPPNLVNTSQALSPDTPPALVQAVSPWVIATNLDVGQVYEDNERTPIARPFAIGSSRPSDHPISLGRLLDDTNSATPLGKYDCKFCGKLFNRPSSLRIHLNSHTGEKPFACPVPGCGRSFSVLSNMRRHTRVHTPNSKEQEGLSEDEESGRSSPVIPPSTSTASTGLPQTAHTHGFSRPRSRTDQRRDSNTSTSSRSSRRSPSFSSEGDKIDKTKRSEKRS